MIQKAFEYLIKLGQVEIKEINGQQYSTKQLFHMTEPQPVSIAISTLTGLVDFIKSNIDEIEGKLLIQVVDYKKVVLFSPLKIDENRDCYIVCNAVTPDITFDRFIDAENFNIMLQSCFLTSDDRTAILKLIGNIKEENVRNNSDDGITQTVTAKAGINLAEDVRVPNPVTLVPFMTFTEIEQPEIEYVFRMQNGPRAALFEADGGAWKLAAVHSIKEYLQGELKDCNIEIIA